MNAQRLDMDPAPRRSPRLYAQVEAIPHSRRMDEVRGSKLSEAKLRRLRMMAVIYACRDRPEPIPYSTLIVILGISEMHAIRLYKLACERNLRRSRV